MSALENKARDKNSCGSHFFPWDDESKLCAAPWSVSEPRTQLNRNASKWQWAVCMRLLVDESTSDTNTLWSLHVRGHLQYLDDDDDDPSRSSF